MHIAIIGTRGIPNNYGGFEQCAEYLAAGLVKLGFKITVYNSHNHPYTEDQWNGVEIIRCYDPEHKLGTAGQFIYDLNCIMNLRKRKFDIILQLGYTSNSIWGRLLPKNAVVTTNMDGLEWKRTKYSNIVRKFLLYAEKLGVQHSDYLISDSIGIQEYLKNKYAAESTFIPYGANKFNTPNPSVLSTYNVEEGRYDMLIARLEPENSIDIILEGVVLSTIKRIFLVVGGNGSKYGTYLKNKYAGNENIRFIGGIYDIHALDSLRYFSNIYFHGHTVGGTNPSLLEAMASSSLICANDNSFNRYILGNDALYFSTAEDVKNVLTAEKNSDEINKQKVKSNQLKIEEIYPWDKIIDAYANHFKLIAGKILRK
jgi:glycosyltransferase involved in cell wall biosynthesis